MGRASAGASRRTSFATRAVELAREGMRRIVIQRQLDHFDLGLASTYLPGIDNPETIETAHARRAPKTPSAL